MKKKGWTMRKAILVFCIGCELHHRTCGICQFRKGRFCDLDSRQSAGDADHDRACAWRNAGQRRSKGAFLQHYSWCYDVQGTVQWSCHADDPDAAAAADPRYYLPRRGGIVQRPEDGNDCKVKTGSLELPEDRDQRQSVEKQKVVFPRTVFGFLKMPAFYACFMKFCLTLNSNKSSGGCLEPTLQPCLKSAHGL